MAEEIKQPPADQRCENCLFYVTGTIGHCNRYPPQILIHQNTAKSRDDFLAVFPNVAANDWCGEWRTTGPAYRR